MDQPGDWALCRKHWPLVPARQRAAWRRAEKRYKATEYGSTAERRANAARSRLSRALVRKACERALGIG